MNACIWIPTVIRKVLSFVLTLIFPSFFLERGEAAGADPGGTYQPGG